jgi:DNA repair protein RadC
MGENKMQSVNFYSLKMVKEKECNYQVIGSDEQLMQLAKSLKLHEEPEEVFIVVTVNSKNKPNGIFEVSRGILNSSMVHPREVFKRALLNNASAIFCLHNHPSGNVLPSTDDLEATVRLKKAGEILGIKVLDHLIVGEDDFYSMKKNYKI